MSRIREYYTFRLGTPKPTEGLDELRHFVAFEYRRLEREGLFAWHLGKDCVDDGRLEGISAGVDPAAYVRLHLARELWPFEDSIPGLDEEWLFTVIEFLHDHCAAPTNSRWHAWDNCGYHVCDADEDAGRKTFRDRLNRYLGGYAGGFVLSEAGEIWSSMPSGVVEVQPVLTGEPSVDQRVRHAIATYRNRSATTEQKRDAVNSLAGILELQRGDKRLRLPTKDEGRLFEIANQFAIRHMNSSQRDKYDAGIWLDWIFVSFLNAIALSNALVARETSLFNDDTVRAGDLPFE